MLKIVYKVLITWRNSCGIECRIDVGGTKWSDSGFNVNIELTGFS